MTDPDSFADNYEYQAPIFVLAAPLSQVLQSKRTSSTPIDHLYGLERLASVPWQRTWYGTDGLGSVRLTMDDAGSALENYYYDAWGVAHGEVQPNEFGFTGELQNGRSGLLNLRARWYQPQHGRFTARDPFEGIGEQPLACMYINQQCLNAGLCDELYIGIMPVLFGDGLRLFEHIDVERIALEKLKIFESGARTDIWFRVIRQGR